MLPAPDFLANGLFIYLNKYKSAGWLNPTPLRWPLILDLRAAVSLAIVPSSQTVGAKKKKKYLKHAFKGIVKSTINGCASTSLSAGRAGVSSLQGKHNAVAASPATLRLNQGLVSSDDINTNGLEGINAAALFSPLLHEGLAHLPRPRQVPRLLTNLH